MILLQENMDGVDHLKNHVQLWLSHTGDMIKDIGFSKLYATMSAVLFTTFILLSLCFLRRKRSNTILLTGLSGSGKTIIFYQLRDGSSHQGTVTSMDVNEDTFLLYSEASKKEKIKPVHVVDVPGHNRLRMKLDDYLPPSAGIVFVVDALEFLANYRAAAEYLYDILTKPVVVKKKIPMLILCNKSEKISAHSKDFIRKQLQKEIDNLRVSRTAISSADIGGEVMLGVPGEPFLFDHCRNRVAVAEASGLTGELSQLEQFIRGIVN